MGKKFWARRNSFNAGEKKTREKRGKSRDMQPFFLVFFLFSLFHSEFFSIFYILQLFCVQLSQNYNKIMRKMGENGGEIIIHVDRLKIRLGKTL